MSVYPDTGAPMQQSMALDPNQLRPMLVPRSNQSQGVVVHTAYAHRDVSKLYCLQTLMCNFMMCGCVDRVSNNLAKSHYVKVFDNKIEWNEPVNWGTPYFQPGLFNWCNYACNQADRISTVHYDRALLANVAPAQSCCRPCGTHSEMCPNGCLCFEHGEAVVMYANMPPGCCACQFTPMFQCCQIKDVNQYTGTAGDFKDQWTALNGALCCGPHRVIKGVDNAAALAQAINQARDATGQKPITLGMAQN